MQENKGKSRRKSLNLIYEATACPDVSEKNLDIGANFKISSEYEAMVKNEINLLESTVCKIKEDIKVFKKERKAQSLKETADYLKLSNDQKNFLDNLVNCDSYICEVNRLCDTLRIANEMQILKKLQEKERLKRLSAKIEIYKDKLSKHN